MKKFHARYKPVHERVLARTKIPLDQNSDECWLWCGPVNNAGFGLIKGDSSLGDPKMMTVHRVMARHIGLPCKHREVQHTCLNKICVNPKHLTTGRAKDRNKRIIAKHGRNFMRPKNPYKTCKHCNKTTYIIWFTRKHKHCRPGMMDEYNKFISSKV